MKFWQFISVCEYLNISLNAVNLNQKWDKYGLWHKDLANIVDRQDRAVLDSVVPAELCQIIFSQSELKFYLSDGYLRSRPFQKSDTIISVLNAYELYGGEKLEDAIEKGLVKI